MAFAPCPSCRRHVRLEEPTCPFCAGALGEGALIATPDASSRMTRARWFVFATTVSVSAATLACPSGSGGNAPPYGIPPRPEPTELDSGPTEQPETSAIAPPATIEPPAASTTTTPTTAPTFPATAPTTKPTYPGPGGPVAMYGAPPTPNQPLP